MSKGSEAVKEWRIRTKNRMVEALGGKCVCCGYNKSSWALEFHHINSEEKEFSFGGMRANPRSWEAIVKELRKCVLVCSNCHREIEHGILEIPENYTHFDESFVVYENYYKTYNLSDKNYSIKNCVDCGEGFECYKGKSIRCIKCRSKKEAQYSSKLAHKKRLKKAPLPRLG